MFLEPSWVYVSGGKFLKREYSLMLGGRGSIKVSSCSTSRIFQSGTNGSIIGRAHGLRSRHKYSTFHVRKARSGFLTVCENQTKREEDQKALHLPVYFYLSYRLMASEDQTWVPNFQTASVCLPLPAAIFLLVLFLFVFHLSDLSS